MISSSRLAICVVHYGDPARTWRCLRSTAAVEGVEARFLVWNDPVPPAELPADLPPVELVTEGTNLGYAAGANLGCHRAFANPAVDAFL